MMLRYCLFVVLAVTGAHAINQYQDYMNFQNNRGFQFPKLRFPTFASFSPQDLTNKRPGPGENFNGLAISSSSFTNLGPDGKVIRGGGTNIITNRNGVVEQHSYPNDGNEINIGSSSFPQPKIPELPTIQLPQIQLPFIQLPHFPQIPQIKVPFIPLPPVPKFDHVGIQNYKPGQNEDFKSTSFVSYRHETNINGERSAAGVDTIINNNNGKVDKKTYKYGDLNDGY